MAAKVKYEDRLKAVESAVEAVLARLEAIDKKVEAIEVLTRRVDDAESQCVVLELSMDDKIKEVTSETESKVSSVELRSDEKIKVLGSQLHEVADKTAAIELRLSDLCKDWPTPQEALQSTNDAKNRKTDLGLNNKVKAKKQTFADKFRNKSKDTIVLIGDSLARGVGLKLEQQNHMISTRSTSGAHIETITEEIKTMEDNDDRHLVVLAGTNNIQQEGSEVVIAKFKCLLEASKKIKNRKVTVIGIPRRDDLSSYQNSRRIGVNMRLEELCNEQDIEFVGYEPASSRLAKDGLHFNHLGQDELARKIFNHCKTFLM